MVKGDELKIDLFLGLVFLSGFLTQIMQTSSGRFAFSFRDKDIAAYSSGGALIGVVSSALGFVLNFVLGDDFFMLYILF